YPVKFCSRFIFPYLGR
ncbi:hypothetical protein D029_2475B, partial [Vibrio parahaemolyticus 970107]